MVGRALGLVGLVAGCNVVLGLDSTTLAEDRRTLVFDNNASRSDLVAFPVLVSLDPTRIRYEDVVDPKTDLRFVDPDTEQDLPFEIERWGSHRPLRHLGRGSADRCPVDDRFDPHVLRC